MPAKRKDEIVKATNLHFLYGNDEAQVKEAAMKLARQLSPADAGDFGTEIVDGLAENSEHASRLCGQAMEGLQTLPTR